MGISEQDQFWGNKRGIFPPQRIIDPKKGIWGPLKGTHPLGLVSQKSKKTPFGGKRGDVPLFFFNFLTFFNSPPFRHTRVGPREWFPEQVFPRTNSGGILYFSPQTPDYGDFELSDEFPLFLGGKKKPPGAVPKGRPLWEPKHPGEN